MQRKFIVSLACVVLTFLALCASMIGQDQARTQPKLTVRYVEPITHGVDKAARAQAIQSATASASSASSFLPVWNFGAISSRDGNIYAGSMVGANPTIRGTDASVSVLGQIVPVIVKLHTIGVSINPNTGVIKTVAGETTFDPTIPDTACLSAPNNVPETLFRQSPILTNANFNFGGTPVGITQYTDAFQRANFWSLIDRANYHVRLSPIKMFAPIVIDVPAKLGLALSASVFGSCSRLGIVDINAMDAFVVQATLTLPGINTKTFPMFLLHNAVMSVGSPTQIGNCCVLGYHGVNPTNPVTFQTYSPLDFDNTGLFGPGFGDSAVPSHEVAEWVNDPYDVNPTPAWGHTGQVAGCQNNLEVGDPLTGTTISPIVGGNGFTYHLQELAFYSWFYGAPSVGIHGWFSDNATFRTDAGPPCH